MIERRMGERVRELRNGVRGGGDRRVRGGMGGREDEEGERGRETI